MDFSIPKEISEYLNTLDDFIEKKIKPLENEDDNIRFFDHRREHSRTNWDNGGLPTEEWESLLGKMRKLADEAGHLRFGLPEEYGGKNGSNLAMAIIREHLAAKGLGLHNDLQNENSIVGNFPQVLMFRDFGTKEQKEEFINGMLSGSHRISFGLTEPDHGSNPGGMTTNFKDCGDYFLLNGAKLWISNSPFADIAIVWAKNEEGRIKGLIVERGMDGFTTPETHGKWSLRASATGELVFDNVKVPKQNLLPNKDGLGAPLGCLDSARYGIAWGAIGAAMDCYDTALRYSKERHQFGKPIGSFQLQQKKLAEMITEITKAQFLTWRLGVLKNEDRASTAQISMCKRNNVDMALKIARESRQILGGMGITGDYPIMRHMMNLESVVTYEGTHDIHNLILGRYITGIQSFTRTQ